MGAELDKIIGDFELQAKVRDMENEKRKARTSILRVEALMVEIKADMAADSKYDLVVPELEAEETKLKNAVKDWK